jgi:hypothetical protein
MFGGLIEKIVVVYWMFRKVTKACIRFLMEVPHRFYIQHPNIYIAVARLRMAMASNLSVSQFGKVIEYPSPSGRLYVLVCNAFQPVIAHRYRL